MATSDSRDDNGATGLHGDAQRRRGGLQFRGERSLSGSRGPPRLRHTRCSTDRCPVFWGEEGSWLRRGSSATHRNLRSSHDVPAVREAGGGDWLGQPRCLGPEAALGCSSSRRRCIRGSPSLWPTCVCQPSVSDIGRLSDNRQIMRGCVRMALAITCFQFTGADSAAMASDRDFARADPVSRLVSPELEHVPETAAYRMLAVQDKSFGDSSCQRAR